MTFEFLLVIIGLLVLLGVNLYVHWRGAKWLDEQKRKDRMMECDNDNKEVYMVKEDKNLLLRDLCARLPYGVRCEVNTHTERLDSIGPFEEAATFGFQTFDISEVKPYLRPMPSMTEEEMKKYKTISIWGWVRESKVGMTDICPTIEGYDWLNAHHFDYRGLIERGLAIAVTEHINPYKEN